LDVFRCLAVVRSSLAYTLGVSWNLRSRERRIRALGLPRGIFTRGDRGRVQVVLGSSFVETFGEFRDWERELGAR
jgi:hypothetical protein